MANRKEQCLEALDALGSATAREVSEYLYEKGYTRVLERNIAHPRLNELENEGRVRIIDTKFDDLTEKYVSIYEKI